MDDKTFKERVAKLTEVNTVISKLDPSIQAEAFGLLKEYVTGNKKMAPPADDDDDDQGGSAPDDKAGFFNRLDDKKPSDNAFAICAYYYSQHGQVTIALQTIKDIATDVGFTIPGRLDVTISGAQKGGKKLFQSTGRGEYKPTVNGAKFFKDTYKVKPGRKPLSTQPKA